MALSIKSDEADRLARELSELTGESLTDVVIHSLEERLARERRPRGDGAARLRRLLDEAHALPVYDDRPADEIIGYDEHGLPT